MSAWMIPVTVDGTYVVAKVFTFLTDCRAREYVQELTRRCENHLLNDGWNASSISADRDNDSCSGGDSDDDGDDARLPEYTFTYEGDADVSYIRVNVAGFIDENATIDNVKQCFQSVIAEDVFG
jgi:hypothetical protein